MDFWYDFALKQYLGLQNSLSDLLIERNKPEEVKTSLSQYLQEGYDDGILACKSVLHRNKPEKRYPPDSIEDVVTLISNAIDDMEDLKEKREFSKEKYGKGYVIGVNKAIEEIKRVVERRIKYDFTV